MKLHKKIAVYLNYQNANIIEYNGDDDMVKNIDSTFTHQSKMETLNKGENTMHQKEQNEQHTYFKSIIDAVKEHNEILLFGPTKAKDELNNLIKENKHLDNISVVVEKTDELNEKQQKHFVNNYFSKKLPTQSI